MPLFTRHDTDDLQDAYAEIDPDEDEVPGAQIVSRRDAAPAPTRADLAHGYTQTYLPTQHGSYLDQVLSQELLHDLIGNPAPPPPAALLKIRNVFSHLAETHVLPALGIIGMTGLAVWAHSEPHHDLWGGAIMAVGGWLIRSGVSAHRKHGTDADPLFTRGAVALGFACVFAGTDVAAGLAPWTAFATGGALLAGYGLWHGWRFHKLEKRRQAAVALVAAGNTGPALAPYVPPTTPWAQPLSDEEFRLHRALASVAGEGAMLSPVRRSPENPDTWYVIVNLAETKTTPEKLTKSAGELAARMPARRVEVLPGPHPASSVKVVVHDGDDPLAEPVPGRGPVIDSILQPLGFARLEDGSTLCQVLAFNHGLVAGATDNGKSGVMNALLIGTLGCADVQRILIDCKAGAPEFGVYRPVSFTVADNPADGMRVLAGLEGIYRYRGNLLAEKGVPSEVNEDGIPVRKWSPEYGPFILAAIDELAELTSTVPGAAEQIQRLNALVRFVGIINLHATQTPSRKVFGGSTDARLNYQFRVGLRTSESGAINIILGQGAQGRGWRLDQLDLPGKVMVQSREHQHPRVGRAEWYSDEVIAHYVSQYTDFVREHPMDEGSAEAFWEAYHAAEVPDADGSGGGPRGGKRAEPQDAPAPGYGRPHLVVVPTYPDGSEVAPKDVRLWQTLAEFGNDGATAIELAARAEAQGHQHCSQAWVRQRLALWRAQGYVRFEREGREDRHWRTDLRSEAVRDGAAS